MYVSFCDNKFMRIIKEWYKPRFYYVHFFIANFYVFYFLSYYTVFYIIFFSKQKQKQVIIWKLMNFVIFYCLVYEIFFILWLNPETQWTRNLDQWMRHCERSKRVSRQL